MSAKIYNFSNYFVYINSNTTFDNPITKNCKTIDFRWIETQNIEDITSECMLIGAQVENIDINAKKIGYNVETECTKIYWTLSGNNTYQIGTLVSFLTDDINNLSITIKNKEEQIITVGEYKQESLVKNSNNIVVPLYKSNSNTKFIDASLNKNDQEYTYYSNVTINGSKKFFGIKRLPKFIQTDNISLSYNEKPNIPGEVVILDPTTTQTQIYSFKNGAQYVEMNKATANSKDRPLPHYIYSYEYMIDGIIPEPENVNDDLNIGFYGANGYSSSAVYAADFEGLEKTISKYYETDDIEYLTNIYSSYSFIGSYTITVSDQSKKLVSKTNKLEKLSSGTYELTYFEVPEANINAYLQNISYIDIFIRKCSYVKIDDRIKASDINKYYVYDSKSKSYISANNQSDLKNVFAQCISYEKVSSNMLDKNEANILPKYIQNFDYSTEYTDKTKEYHGDFLYIEKNVDGIPVYIPARTGIIGDGSVDYYSSTYVNVKNVKTKPDEGTTIYIKQQYKKINSSIEFELVDKSSIFTPSSILTDYPNVSLEITKQNDYIYNLDISGNTVYADSSQKEIPLETLNNIYYEKTSGSEKKWFEKNSSEEKIKGTIEDLSLASFGIIYKINYDGKWDKASIAKSDSFGNASVKNPNGLYIQVESYNEISYDLCDFTSNIDYYIWKIGKINVKDINFTKDVYVDVTKYGIDANGNDIIEFDEDDIILAKINQFGFIENENVKYYERHNEYALSNDLYKFLNKDYYVNVGIQSQTYYTELLPLFLLRAEAGYDSEDPANSSSSFNSNDTDATDVFPVDDENIGENDKYAKISNNLAKFLINNGNSSYVFLYDSNNNYINYDNEYDESLEYYIKKSIYIEENASKYYVDIAPYNTKLDSIKFFSSKITHYVLSNEYLSFDEFGTHNFDKKFISSKYFYPELTINDGLHQTRDGSYYTNISIYDGTRGAISKALVLQPNIFNVTKYTYKYTTSAYIDASNFSLSEINENHYDDYYLSYYVNDTDYERFRLSAESYSPTYWASYISYLVESELNTTVGTYTLEFKRIKEKTGVFDGRTIDYDDYKSVQYFNNDTFEPYAIRKNNTLFGIIFHDYKAEENIDNKIVNENKHVINGPITDMDNGYPEMQYAFEYDVVELKETIYETDTNEDIEVYQQFNVDKQNTTQPVPFYISNEKELNFTGSYIWNNPQHSYIFAFNNDTNKYEPINIVKKLGYWGRQYEENILPFKISSYNFYVNKDEISSTTATYMYIPMSYVLTSEIVHPKISYEYIVNEINEVSRYTYIYDGKEYNYLTTDIVQENEDGSYLGVARFGADEILVDLIKHTEIDNTSKISEIVHQNEYTSYEYFSYKNAIALANEKIPYLYNIELIPASTHKVQYWNDDSESYAVKTVVDSYAHYVYNYKNEIVPFIVSSYIHTTDEFNVSNLGIISDKIAELIQPLENVATASSGLTNTLNNSFNEFTSNISSTLNGSLTNLSSSINTKSNEIVEAINSISAGDTNRIIISYIDDSRTHSYISYSINDLNDAVTMEIRSIKNNLYNGIQNINDSLSYLENGHHTYWMKVSYSANGMISYVDRKDESLRKNSIVEIIDNSFNIHDVSESVTYNPNGTYDKTYESEIISIAYILKNFTTAKRIPTYEEFMTDLVPQLYAKCEFDKDIVEHETKDENGNVISTGKHKPSPIDLARKSIYRAEVLWNEMKKKGIIN